MTAETFTRNEWLETLIRIRDEQPRRYSREVSAGTRARVEAYERLKREQSRKVAA